MAPEVDERCRVVSRELPHRGVGWKAGVLRMAPNALPILGDLIATRPGRERIVPVAKHLECAQAAEKYDKPDLQGEGPERVFIEKHRDITLGQRPLVVGSRHDDKHPWAETFQIV